MTTGKTIALTRRTLLIFKSVFFFFFLQSYEFLIFYVLAPYQIHGLQIFFSHSIGFHFVVSFARQKLFKLMLSHLSIPAFIA